MSADKFLTRDKDRFDLVKIYSEEMAAIHFGQAWDIYWHNQKKKVPTSS